METPKFKVGQKVLVDLEDIYIMETSEFLVRDGKEYIVTKVTDIDNVSDDEEDKIWKTKKRDDSEHQFAHLHVDDNDYWLGLSNFLYGLEPVRKSSRGLDKIKYVPQNWLKLVYEEKEPETQQQKPKEPATIEEEVEKHLSEKEKSKKFKDTKGRIGGSKKEKSAFKKITATELFQIEDDEATAISLVTKKKVFPKFILDEFVDAGIPSGVTYMIFELQKKFPPKPKVQNKVARQVYLRTAEYFIERFTPNEKSDEIVNTLDEFKNICTNYTIDTIFLYDILYPSVTGHTLDTNWEEMGHTSPKEAIGLFKQTAGISQYWQGSSLVKKIITEIFGKTFYEFVRYPSSTKMWNKAKEYNGLSEFELDRAKERIRVAKDHIRVEKEVEKTIDDFLEKKIPLKEMIDMLVEYENHIDGLPIVTNRKKEYRRFAKMMAPIPFNRFDKPRKNKKRQERYDYNDKGYYKLYEVINYLFENNDPTILDWWMERRKNWVERTIKAQENAIEKYEEQLTKDKPDWSWAEKKKRGKVEQRTDIKIHSNPALDYVKRTGGLFVSEDHFTSDESLKKFYKDILGITRIEFGTSLPDRERKAFGKFFAESMIDLCEMLNIKVQVFTGFGNLGIKFASSGSGSASAHYEGNRQAINLTRRSSNGSTAHEIGHYFDNLLFNEKNWWYKNKENIESKPTGIVGWKYGIKTDAYASHIRKNFRRTDYGTRWTSRTTIENWQVQMAWRDIWAFIWDGRLYPEGSGLYIEEKLGEGEFNEIPKEIKHFWNRGETGSATFKVVIPAKTNAKRTIRKWSWEDEETAKDIDLYFKKFFDHVPSRKFYYENTKGDLDAYGAKIAEYGLKEYEIEFKVQNTLFYEASMAGTPYWKRPEEMFARAFEVYIFDKLANAGRVNTFLVSDGNYWHNFYPQDWERKILYHLFDRFFTVFKRAYEIPDFEPYIKERVDEYVSLNEKGEVVEGVEINKKTGQVAEFEGKDSAIKNKLLKLKEMIEETAYYQEGGIIDPESITHKLSIFGDNFNFARA